MKKVISFLALIFIGSSLFAQTPATVNYQAVARDTAGRILSNRSVTVRMTVYQGSPTGTSVYTENHSLSTNKFGLLNLELGSVNQSNFTAIDWGKSRHYLGVEINWGSGFTEMSRTELVSVPYALFSKETARLRGFNVDTTQGTKGQVLKYDGSRWRAGWDSLPQYTAGGGILISGNKIIAVDSSDNNEIQDLQLTANILRITKNGTATNIDLAKYLDNKDTQQITIKSDTIFLQRGGFVKMPFDKVNDADADPVNEIQVISKTGTSVNLSKSGGSILLFDDDSTNEIQDLQLNGNILKITKNGSATSINLSAYLDNTDSDTQQLTIRSDTIFLQRGGLVKLPTDKVNDADSVIGNEIVNVGSGYGAIARSGGGTSASPYKIEFIQGQLDNHVLVWDSINQLWKLGIMSTSGVLIEADGVIGNEIKDVGTGNGMLSRSGSGTSGNPYKMDVISGTAAGQVWRWNGSNWAAAMPADTSATNELQTLSISNDTLFLSGGGSVKLKSGSGSFWSTNGNSGLVDSVSFIGTTDSTPLRFRVNNRWAGEINDSNNNISIGLNSNPKSNGRENIAIGKGALGNTTGFYSNLVAIGDSALFKNGLNASGSFEGRSNTALGSKSMLNNTIGRQNTAVGDHSLHSNDSGRSNSAFGYYSLSFNTNGNFNTAMGYSSLGENTIGIYNAAFGHNALNFNTSGSRNVALGGGALYLNTNGSYNTAIGISALNSNTTGTKNAAIGGSALYFNTIGYYNCALGDSSLYDVRQGNNNIGIGYKSMVPNGSTNNQVRIGNTTITYAGVQVSWTVTSDIFWKKDIQNSNLGLDFISKLRPVSFVRKNDENEKLEYGFIAQELDAALRSSGVVNDGIISTDAEGKLGVRYNDLLAPMVKAIQEQNALIQEQRAAIEDLKKRLAEVEAQQSAPKN